MIGPSPDKIQTQFIASGGAYSAYLVYDTFTDANGTAIASHVPEKRPGSNAWAASLGTWQIQSNAARCTGSAPDFQSVAVIDSGEADVSVVINAKQTVAFPEYGAVVNYVDQSNFWMCIRSSATLYIYERSAGAFTVRDTAAVASPGIGNSEVIRVVTNGDTIDMYLNDVLQNSYTVAGRPHKTATKHGLRDYTPSGTTGDFELFSVS